MDDESGEIGEVMGLYAAWAAAAPVGALFSVAGWAHFATPGPFLGIMKGMPLESTHMAAVYVSGVFELLGGVGLLLGPLLGQPAVAELAAWGLFWLVVAVSPANINMYLNNLAFGKDKMSYG